MQLVRMRRRSLLSFKRLVSLVRQRPRGRGRTIDTGGRWMVRCTCIYLSPSDAAVAVADARLRIVLVPFPHFFFISPAWVFNLWLAGGRRRRRRSRESREKRGHTRNRTVTVSSSSFLIFSFISCFFSLRLQSSHQLSHPLFFGMIGGGVECCLRGRRRRRRRRRISIIMSRPGWVAPWAAMGGLKDLWLLLLLLLLRLYDNDVCVCCCFSLSHRRRKEKVDIFVSSQWEWNKGQEGKKME